MSYDVEAVRACFPALRAGAAHFDGPGGSQVPESVAAAVAATLTSPLANRGRVTQAERNADDVVLAARAAVADLVGGDPGGVEVEVADVDGVLTAWLRSARATAVVVRPDRIVQSAS